MSCHHRQFNETLFLPLCTSSKDSKGKEHIYQIVVRGTVRASNNNRLVGIWSEPQITSFQCNQGNYCQLCTYLINYQFYFLMTYENNLKIIVINEIGNMIKTVSILITIENNPKYTPFPKVLT